MKRAFFATLMIAAMMSVGCQNDDDNFISPEASYDKISLFATSPGGNSTKVGFEDLTLTEQKISLTWENNGSRVDSFTLYDESGDRVGDFKYSGTDGAKEGEFTQASQFELIDGAEYTAVIPAGSYATLSEHDAASATEQQSVSTLGDINYLDGAVKLKGQFTYSDNGENSIAFAHELSFVRLLLTMPTEVAAAKVKMTDCAVDYTLTLPGEGSGETITTFIAVNPVESSESRDIDFVITDTAGEEHRVTKSGTTQSFEAGTYYTIGVTVEATEPISDYYTQGYTIDGVTFDSSNATSLIEEDATLTAQGIYFVEDGVTVTLGTKYSNNFVLIGRTPGAKPTVKLTGYQHFSNVTVDGVTYTTGTGMIYKNLNVVVDNTLGYTFAFAHDNLDLDYWVIDDCTVTTVTDKPLSYFNKLTSSVKNVIFKDSKFVVNVSANGNASRIAYFNNAAFASFESVSITNSKFYASEYVADGPIFWMNSSTVNTPDLDVTIQNNTIVNYTGTGNGSFCFPSAKSANISKNIFWASASRNVHSYLVKLNVAAISTANIDDNIFYGLGSEYNWYDYANATYSTQSTLTKVEESPFSAWSVESGTFTQKEEYSTYGSSIE